MAFFLRRLGRKALPTHSAPVVENLGSAGIVWFRVLRRFAAESAEQNSGLSVTGSLKQRSVGLFWDLDNKPPKNVSPFKAATRLLEMAAGFGNVVDAVAYANHHAFSHVPTWVHEERKRRKMLDELEVKGLVKPEELYVCGICGAKKKTRVELTKHFKSLHEREQKKRMNRLESLKGKKKQKERFWDNNAEKMFKYKDAARSLIVPKVGYGLMQDLRRAGLYVRTVEDKPEAADIALKEHMTKSMRKGVSCICLVSDDSDFTSVLKMARERNLHTVVVGDLRILSAHADTYFSWAEVASGIAEQKARVETRQMVADFMNRVGDKLECHRYKGFGFDDDSIDDEHSGSDSDAELEDIKGWPPHDRDARPENEEEGFDFFSDDSSESDSDAGPYKFPVKPRKLRSYVAHGEFETKMSSRSRAFSTERKVESSDDSSFHEIISETDLRASLPKGSRGAPSKTKAVYESQSSTDNTPATSVRAPAISETASPSNEVRETASTKANSVNKLVHSFFDDSAEKKNNLESDRNHSTIAGNRADEAGSTSDSCTVGRGRKKKKKFFGEEDDIKKQKRTGSKKPKNHFGGRSSEQVPFYSSGFASESREDCDRINNWYFDFWKGDEEEYKGRRIHVHEKKKKTTN